MEETNRPPARCLLNNNLRLPSCGADPVTNLCSFPPQLGYADVLARNYVVGRAVRHSNGALSVGLRW